MPLEPIVDVKNLNFSVDTYNRKAHLSHEGATIDLNGCYAARIGNSTGNGIYITSGFYNYNNYYTSTTYGSKVVATQGGETSFPAQTLDIELKPPSDRGYTELPSYEVKGRFQLYIAYKTVADAAWTNKTVTIYAENSPVTIPELYEYYKPAPPHIRVVSSNAAQIQIALADYGSVKKGDAVKTGVDDTGRYIETFISDSLTGQYRSLGKTVLSSLLEQPVINISNYPGQYIKFAGGLVTDMYPEGITSTNYTDPIKTNSPPSPPTQELPPSGVGRFNPDRGWIKLRTGVDPDGTSQTYRITCNNK